jgi:hypothetical protein
MAAGCVGNIGDNGVPEGPMISKQAEQEVAVSGLRRLSVTEYRQTIRDLLGVEATAAFEILPSDTLSPFDNDYTLQTPSEPLIKGAELLAGDVAEAVIASPELRVEVVGCEPSSPSDSACFQAFVTSFGRRALRRPLSAAEVERFSALQSFGVDEGDFWFGVGAALRAFLQHPEFLYRVEIGTAVPGLSVHRLNAFEVSARLSYFLLGSTPPDWLLDAAEAGDLDTPDGIAAAATELFADDRAKGRVNRFHAMWLSYDKLSRDGLFGAMHDETNALLERIIFEEKRPWVEVLTAGETFVTPELAEHYGLPSPGTTADWVEYADSGRLGLLSQGTFLSAVPKFGDTSPTQRGLLVRTRLFCETIPKPPADLKVNVDMPPPSADPDACKQERYYMSKDPICAGCHKLMDPIGFGLESYDATGQFRETEPNRPECVIDGEGDFAGMGTFNGPAELAQLAVESGKVEACVATQLYRFAIGRTELDEYDFALIERVVSATSSDGGLDFEAFITSYVTSEAFVFRRDEVVP